MMTLTEAVKTVFANYANVEGRAMRSEYWWFTLFNVAVQFTLMVLAAAFLATVFNLLLFAYVVISTIPSITVCVRRLHDVDRSGWWLLLALIPLGAFVLLWFFVQPGTNGPNRFGPPFQSARLTEHPSNEIKVEL